MKIDNKFVKFIIIGVSNTIISYVLFYFFLSMTNKPGVSQAIAYSGGILWSYIWNSRWTFQHKNKHPRVFTDFIVLQLTLLALSSGAIEFAVGILKKPPMLSWIVIMAVVTGLNYFFARAWVFRERTAKAPGLSSDRRTLFILSVSIVIAAFFGLCYGDSGNHPTYIPPGLKLLDPGFLSQDWWITHVEHYHIAFAYLVAWLAALNSLEWGLALGNVICISLSLYTLWLWVQRSTQRHQVTAWLLIAYTFLVSRGMLSVGQTYLFGPALQASSIATLFTLAGLYFFIITRPVYAGLCLGLSSLFHTNFLIINLTACSIAFLLLHAPDIGRKASWRSLVVEASSLFLPSLIVLCVMVPLILKVSAPPLNPADAQLASFIFFDFAVPFHYKPSTYLNSFWELAGWQGLGLSWLFISTMQPDMKKRTRALYIAMLIILWAATAATTVIFSEFISRLFFWRLAPFSVLIAVLIMITGAAQALATDSRPVLQIRLFWLLGCFLSILFLARFMAWRFGLLSMASAALILVPITVTFVIFLKWFLPGFFERLQQIMRPSTTLAFAKSAVVASLALFAGLTYHQVYVVPGTYNLIYQTQKEQQEYEMLRWLKKHTDERAILATPPDHGLFRLIARRAIIVDKQSIPFSASNILEWYHRLEDVSGTRHPKKPKDVFEGYAKMDAARLAFLRQKYAIDYVVLQQPAPKAIGDWTVVFSNAAFIILKAPGSSSEP